MTSLEDTPLEVCSLNPITGYDRDGYCKNNADDSGTHVVCAKLTDDFLKFTKSKGNNLITRREGFPGLKSGQQWCLCGLRWEEARRAGKAPSVVLGATEKSALRFGNYQTFKNHAKKSCGKHTRARRRRK
jgi:uncharacterized protein (DUF2237 family)